ncbi:MAG: class I SAM-dependent methyltransferase [bacterium]|nr:class I SAM-dependent methyltransferase [bacterium]
MRLQKFSYPFTVSQRLLNIGLQNNKSVLDIGSGPNTELGKWLRQNQILYIAADIKYIFLQEQAKSSHPTIQCKSSSLPLDNSSVDISHLRFVLMHLSSDERRVTISEMLRVSKNTSIFIEFDWSTFKGSETVNSFRDLAIDILDTHVDLFLGKNLRKEILKSSKNTGLTVNHRNFKRGPGNYYNELLPLANSLLSAAKLFRPEKETSVNESIGALTEESCHPAISFVPPTLSTIVVEKHN